MLERKEVHTSFSHIKMQSLVLIKKLATHGSVLVGGPVHTSFSHVKMQLFVKIIYFMNFLDLPKASHKRTTRHFHTVKIQSSVMPKFSIVTIPTYRGHSNLSNGRLLCDWFTRHLHTSIAHVNFSHQKITSIAHLRHLPPHKIGPAPLCRQIDSLIKIHSLIKSALPVSTCVSYQFWQLNFAEQPILTSTRQQGTNFDE